MTLLLMFSSSFPLPLTGTGTTFQAWLKDFNVDIASIGLLSLVGLPYNLKFLWSPLLDRFSAPFLHRRTGWIALFQICLMLSIATMGWLNPATQLNSVVIAALLIAFFSASQDIVIDAYRIDLLRPDERGAGGSMVMLGGRLAFLASGALALMLADQLPWPWVFTLLATCLMIGLVTSLYSPIPENVSQPPHSLADAVIKPFTAFRQIPGAIQILFFVVFYKLGDTLAASLLTPFLMEVGFSKTDIGTVNKVFGLFCALMGGLVSGAVIPRLGIYRCLWVFGILQAVSNLVFVGLAINGKSYAWMVAAIGVENFCGGLGTAAFVAYLMGLCDQRFSATQYALLSSLTAIARTWFAAGSGFAVNWLGWPSFFAVSAVCALPGLWLLARLRALEPAQGAVGRKHSGKTAG